MRLMNDPQPPMEQFHVAHAFGMRDWHEMYESEREQRVKMVRRELAMQLAMKLVATGHIRFSDSDKDIISGTVRLHACITAGAPKYVRLIVNMTPWEAIVAWWRSKWERR